MHLYSLVLHFVWGLRGITVLVGKTRKGRNK